MPHLAFVPFTGFRVRERELLELGMSLPGLQARGDAVAGLPALGLLTLAALTPEHWSRSWHEAPAHSRELLEAVLAARPTLVAVSALTASTPAAHSFVRAARAEGLNVVVGGLHTTALPEEAEEFASAVVVGEGEPVWGDVLADAEAGTLRSRYQAESPFDLSASPVPAYELLPPGPRPRFLLQTERGCPLACEFCAASRLLGPFREKPIEQIEAELDAICAIDPRPRIELADDNTFVGSRDPEPLLNALAQARARWFTEADWRLGEQPETVARLAEAGCAQVLVGVESLVTRHRGMGPKTASPERMFAAVEAIQAAGVPVNACFVVGADGETHATLEALGTLLASAPFAEVQLTLQTPFPGTSLRKRLEREGRILLDRGWEHYTLFDVTFAPKPLSVEELERGFRELLSSVFSPTASARRDRIRRDVLATGRSARGKRK